MILLIKQCKINNCIHFVMIFQLFILGYLFPLQIFLLILLNYKCVYLYSSVFFLFLARIVVGLITGTSSARFKFVAWLRITL